MWYRQCKVTVDVGYGAVTCLVGFYDSCTDNGFSVSLGKVVSKTDGESIIGATVIETNQTSNGTITDIDGNFTLSVPQGAELSISYIGFKTVNVKAQATLNIDS